MKFIEKAIADQLKKQIPVAVKDFEWGEWISEWISDVALKAMESPEVRKPIQKAVAAAIASDKRMIAQLVAKAIKKTS